MKAIAKTEPRKGVALVELADPVPGPQDVVLRPEAAAICGSDLTIFRWESWASATLGNQLPFVLGHETCATVLEVGSEVTRFQPGDRVAVETHIPCGQCWYCRNDRAHVCANMVLFGHQMDGCFSEVAMAPARGLWKVTSSVPSEHAAVLEPLGVAIRGAHAAPVQGEPVAVLGAGPIGLLVTAVVSTMDPSALIVIEPSPERRELARAVGAETVLDPTKPGLEAAVKQLTEGVGVETVIECSGNADAVMASIGYIRVCGFLVSIGNPKRDLVFNAHQQINHHELTIRGLFGRRLWDTWVEAETFAWQHPEKLNRIVTARFPLDRHAAAFAAAMSGQHGKVLFTRS